MRLSNKVVIITGSTSGIGRESAILFAKEGAKVIINGRNEERGKKVEKEIIDNGGTAKFFRADVSRSKEAKELIDFTVNHFGKIDILYNNAAVYVEGLLHEFEEKDWDMIINTNLKSIFLCSKFAIQEMLKNKSGVIINTSSTDGLAAVIKASAYCASKAAIINLTKSMALDYGSKNIRINCICPGLIYTELIDDMVNWYIDPEKEIRKWIEVHPIGRIGKPIDVSYAALFLASDESSFITGATIVVDGGQSTKFWTPWESKKKSNK